MAFHSLPPVTRTSENPTDDVTPRDYERIQIAPEIPFTIMFTCNFDYFLLLVIYRQAFFSIGRSRRLFRLIEFLLDFYYEVPNEGYPKIPYLSSSGPLSILLLIAKNI